MTRRLSLLFFALAAAFGGCSTTPPATEAARYDLGVAPMPSARSALPISGVVVDAASWLAGQDLSYRLLYADPQRRQRYAQARWAAPPAELLERHLVRRMVFAGGAGAGCRLRLSLDELEQRFEDAQRSSVHLVAQATLLPARGGSPLARRSFSLGRSAPSPDAPGGVAATRALALQLGDDIDAWLGELARGAAPVRCAEITPG